MKSTFDPTTAKIEAQRWENFYRYANMQREEIITLRAELARTAGELEHAQMELARKTGELVDMTYAYEICKGLVK